MLWQRKICLILQAMVEAVVQDDKLHAVRDPLLTTAVHVASMPDEVKAEDYGYGVNIPKHFTPQPFVSLLHLHYPERFPPSTTLMT